MPASTSHAHLAAPNTRGVARSLECLRATQTSLAVARSYLEASRLAMERSYALLAASTPRAEPADPGARRLVGQRGSDAGLDGDGHLHGAGVVGHGRNPTGRAYRGKRHARRKD